MQEERKPKIRKNVVIGLTGPTGAGKSTVSKALADAGCVVIDADQVARIVVETDPDCLKELKQEFGPEIFRGDGRLDRKGLAKKAFSVADGSRRLNEITHPPIMRCIGQMMHDYFAKGHTILILDAPLLFESGAGALCEKIIAVTAPGEIRMNRIMERDGISREAAFLRMSAQKDDAYYRSRSQYHIENTGDLERLYEAALNVLNQIQRDLEL